MTFPEWLRKEPHDWVMLAGPQEFLARLWDAATLAERKRMSAESDKHQANAHYWNVCWTEEKESREEEVRCAIKEATMRERGRCARIAETEHMRIPGSPTFDRCISVVVAAIRNPPEESE